MYEIISHRRLQFNYWLYYRSWQAAFSGDLVADNISYVAVQLVYAASTL